MRERLSFPNRIGMAWPRERLAEDKLRQGRDILDFARRGEGYFIGIIEAYLTIHNQNLTEKERIKAGESWRNGVMLHVIASIDPISKGKIENDIPAYVKDVEIKARQTIHDITIEKGGTEEQALYLEEKLTRMAKSFQIKSGVLDNTGLPVSCK